MSLQMQIYTSVLKYPLIDHTKITSTQFTNSLAVTGIQMFVHKIRHFLFRCKVCMKEFLKISSTAFMWHLMCSCNISAELMGRQLGVEEPPQQFRLWRVHHAGDCWHTSHYWWVFPYKNLIYIMLMEREFSSTVHCEVVHVSRGSYP